MDFFQIFSIGILLILAIKNGASEISSSLPPNLKIIPWDHYRLPKTVEPISYNIELTPLFEPYFTFYGKVEILAMAKEDITMITLHAGPLEIITHEITIKDIPSKGFDYYHNNKTDKLSIYATNNTIAKDTQFKIKIEYKGNLSDNMKGFYKSSYRDNNARLRWLAATQFGMTYARNAFPCFDEPEFKASFKISIIRGKNYKCLSNMELTETIPIGEEMYRDEFDTSHKMSTYLVAFLISDFNSTGDEHYKVWSRPNVLDQTKFASENVQRTIKYFENQFDMKYPLKKLDMVAMPDMAVGGMENWGLIMYRESKILYDPSKNSLMTERDANSILLHECSHMWFGNLLTPSWWDYVWLSEGFATYYGYMAGDMESLRWRMKDRFVVEEQMAAYEADALQDSKPLTRRIVDVSGIDSMGDRITYSKGASIIRMMNTFLGHKIFDDGIRKYIKSRAKDNVEPKHLWDAIQSVVDSNLKHFPDTIKNIMKTWTEQPGFPVITVSQKQNSISLTQKRFLQNNSHSELVQSNNWWVPITYATGENPNFDAMQFATWMKEETLSLGLDLKPNGWVIMNLQNSGFYRVNYDSDLWERIIKELMDETSFKRIHEINRATLIDDSLALARAGMLDYKIPFKLLNYLKHEKEYLPFRAAFKALNYFTQKFMGHKEEQSFAKYMLWLIEKTFPKTNEDKIHLRAELHRVACTFGDHTCKWQSIRNFFQWRSTNKNTIYKNHKPTIYCTAIKYGSTEDWQFLWNVYLKENSPKEQKVILKALGCTLDKEIFKRYFSYALDEKLIRRQDSVKVFSAVYSSSLNGSEYFLDYMSLNFNEVHKYYDDNTIAKMLKEASQLYNTPEMVAKYKTFLWDHQKQLSSVMPILNESVKNVEYELEWFRKNSPSITSTIITYVDEFHPDRNLFRLPRNKVAPKKYSIHVKPSFDNANFYGTVKIIANVETPTDSIILHAKEITIIKVEVFHGNKQLDCLAILEEDYELLRIVLVGNLARRTEIQIKITYTGILNDKNYGFYKSSYLFTSNKAYSNWVFPSNATHHLAATHFEPTGARMMFPCFDEPQLKAHFILTVTVPKFYRAISNTNVREIIPYDNGVRAYTFEETPLMSTYLLALVVSDFEMLSDHSNPGRNYTIWARANAINDAQYALSMISKTVKFFNNTFNIEYELPKLDMIALPDFNLGGMENWGLITFRETSLLYDNNHVSLHKKQSIANVIVHEIAHQWFGNLVTPSWWDNIWLSEGFARYFQYYASAKLNPDWSLESQFVVDQIHAALAADDSTFSRAMDSTAMTPAEINDKFDVISYSKAASVLRMLEKYIGSKIFYQALGAYLSAKKYSDANPSHLYVKIQSQLGSKKYNIEGFMDSWTKQSGYPLVEVNIKDSLVTFKQKRFLIRSNPEVNETPGLWKIPITWISPNYPEYDGRENQFLLEKEKSTIKIETNDDCKIFNVEQGFYRVNYSPEHWLKIIQCLKYNDDSHFIIPEINRASLLDDLFNLGRAGYVNYNIVLSATQYLEKESSYAPWRAFFNGIKYLRDRFYGTDMYEPFRRYVLTLTDHVDSKLGQLEKPEDSHADKLLREDVFEWMCRFDHEECRFYSNYIWHNGTLSHTPPIHLRKSVYCYLIRNQPEAFQLLWNWYETSISASEKSLILESLACSSNKSNIHLLLNKAIMKDHSKIRYHDSLKIFSFIYEHNLDAVGHVIDFIQNQHKDIYNFYGDHSVLRQILGGIVEKISTQDLSNKFKDMINKLNKDHPSLVVFMELLEQRVDFEMKWYSDHSMNFRKWLELNYEKKYTRLPNNFSPTHYEIHIKQYLLRHFEGSVGISMTVMEPSRFLVLHADGLNIEKITAYDVVENANDRPRPIPILHYKLFSKQQILMIIFERSFEKCQKIQIIVKYYGALRDDMRGFYRTYPDLQHDNRWTAATNFQPTYARSAFPCFDEPAFKATFSIRIERPNNYRSLSNMPLHYTYDSIKPGRSWDVYHESNKMSTHLVAFVVSDFESLQPHNSSVKIWGRSNIVSYGKSMELQTLKVIAQLEKYLEMKNPLEKLDLVGIPDFHGEAMENWGLITFKEDLLFNDDQFPTKAHGKHANRVLVNKLVRTWFGNLVTCEWWDCIWLHEGFATYFQWIFENFDENESSNAKDFTVHELQNSLLIEDDNRRFGNARIKKTNVISSKKAASLIRMIHLSLGDEVFKKALSRYLNKHQYGTTTPDDLWGEFSNQIQTEQSNQVSIKTVMDRWTKVQGYPIINVNRVQHDKIRISQNINNSETYQWTPITIATGKQPDFTKTMPQFWLGKYVLDIPVDANDWVVVNVQQAGYYRVNYDSDLWARIIKVLSQKDHKVIHLLNRAQIVDDFFNLAREGLIKDWGLIVEIMKYLKKEQEYLPWKSFFNGIQYLDERFQGHKNHTILVNETLSLIRSWNSTESSDIHTISDLHYDWACKYQHNKTVQHALMTFAVWRGTPRQWFITPHKKLIVFCTAMKNESYDDWKYLWNEYNTINSPTEKLIILKALGCTRNKTTLNSYLDNAIESKYLIRKEHLADIFESIYSNGHFGANYFLDWFIAKYYHIYRYYNDWQIVGNLALKFTPYISTDKQMYKWTNFIQRNSMDLQEIMDTLEQTNKNINFTNNWFKQHSEAITESFHEKVVPVPKDPNNSNRNSLNFSVLVITTLTIIFFSQY